MTTHDSAPRGPRRTALARQPAGLLVIADPSESRDASERDRKRHSTCTGNLLRGDGWKLIRNFEPLGIAERAEIDPAILEQLEEVGYVA